MKSTSQDLAIFQSVARENPNFCWFVIADSAQDPRLPCALLSNSRNVRCLFGGAQNAPLSRHSPHLVEICSPLQYDPAWNWVSKNASSTSSVSIIATLKEFDSVFDQFAACIEVKIPGLETMFFAFWDPAILGTLVGQSDDLTLHVPGPVLTQVQQSLLMEGLARWWYWDRSCKLHEIATPDKSEKKESDSIELTQHQVDDLVEASVPDHVLYYIKLNHPYLLAQVSSSEQYEIVRNALVRARRIGLASMRDLVDFVCIVLLYKEQFDRDENFAALVKKVSMGEMDFRTALSYIL